MSKIEWTGETWNPIVGCSIVSPGCTNCYAMKWAYARMDQPHNQFPHYRGTTTSSKAGGVWSGKVAIAPEHILMKPLKRKAPRTWFVNSMGDLFHESVPDEWIDRVFAVMALAPQHTFQVLTKRSARMRQWFSHGERAHYVGLAMLSISNTTLPQGTRRILWPRPNVWIGVSAERQKEADERIPDLLATPAAVRFVSAEPLLGPIDFTSRRLWNGRCDPCVDDGPCTAGPVGLDWIIVGGESGHGARPMHPEWARSIRDQCIDAGVAFFFKQWGAWLPSNDGVTFTEGADWASRHFPGRPVQHQSSGHTLVEVGKARAGRLLDGVQWDQMPGGAQ